MQVQFIISRRTAHLFHSEVLVLSKLHHETYLPLLYRDIDCHMASRRMSKLAEALKRDPTLGGHVRRLRLWQRQPGAGAGVIFLAPTEQEEMRCILAACEPQILHLVLCSFPETALECIRPVQLYELSITIYEHSRYVSTHSELDLWYRSLRNALSLRELDWYRYHRRADVDRLVDQLNDPTFLPNLKHLRVGCADAGISVSWERPAACAETRRFDLRQIWNPAT